MNNTTHSRRAALVRLCTTAAIGPPLLAGALSAAETATAAVSAPEASDPIFAALAAWRAVRAEHGAAFDDEDALGDKISGTGDEEFSCDFASIKLPGDVGIHHNHMSDHVQSHEQIDEVIDKLLLAYSESHRLYFETMRTELHAAFAQEHDRMSAGWQRIGFAQIRERQGRLSDQKWRLFATCCDTVPTTLAGIVAKIQFINDDLLWTGFDHDEELASALASLESALRRLAGMPSERDAAGLRLECIEAERRRPADTMGAPA